MRKIIVPQLGCNKADRQRCGTQQGAGGFHFAAGHIFFQAVARLLFHQAGQIVRVQMNIFGQLIAAQLTFQVLINILLQLVQ